MIQYIDPIAVIIATSKGRTELLHNRSLRSVYLQEGVNPVEVVIVDDNPVREGKSYSDEYNKIKKVIHSLREEVLKYTYNQFVENVGEVSFDKYFRTTLMKNTRTHGHSGTGAWNTAIFYLNNKYRDEQLFVAILDDDDEYLGGYLRECTYIIRKKGKNIAAIFPFIKWLESEKEMVFRFTKKDIKPKSFFIGNPGIQGSNMCIRLDLLKEIGGFDESLHSATDRDLMIRLLNYLAVSKENLDIHIIPKVMVIHHADRPDRVTNNIKLKKLGLDLFYAKWKNKFSYEDFIKSLERSRRLFEYEYRK